MASQQKASIDISIIIPAYREEKRIGRTLDELAQYLKTDAVLKTKQIEVIVVSADSPDKTHRLVNRKKGLFADLILIKPGPQVGKGRDVKVGVLQARGGAILFMDADMATPLKHIKEFYDLYLQNNEVIIATRDFLRYRHNPFRIAVSRLGNIIFQLAGGVWVEDSQCGFKMFSARAARICFGHLTITGWGFDMEILTAARANKFPITSVRIHDWEAIPEGVFEDNVIANTARSFVDLGLIFTRRMRGYYRS